MFRLAAGYLRSAGWKDWDVIQLPGEAGMVWWIFRRGQDAPAVVGKFCVLPAAVKAGLRECAALKLLHPFAEQLGLPTLLFQADAHPGLVYLQSGVPGKPLRNELPLSGGKDLSAQIDIAEGWLEKLQTLVGPARDSGVAFRQVLACAPERLPERLLSAAHDALPLLADVPAVAVHGDFWARNVLAAPGRISVVDWDAFHYGSPLEDLFTFAGAMVYQWKLNPGQLADIVWSVFLGSSLITPRVRTAALRTLTRWNVSRDLLGPLFLFSLVSQLGRTDSAGHDGWRVFAARYAGAGFPPPFAA